MLNRFSAYLAAGALIIGVTAGWKVRDWQCDAAYAKALEKANKQRDKAQGAVDEISATYEAERDQTYGVATQTKETIREIYRTAPAVPVDCNPDPRIVGMLESSVGSANADATGKSGN